MNTLEKINFENILLDPFAKKFNSHLQTIAGLKKADKLLIAVSGGMDSMALFVLCKSLNRFGILLAHIDHRLRKNSDRDMKFVQSIAKHCHVPFHSRKLNPAQIEHGDSVESWARKNRYELLNEIAENTGANWIMTAHHGNDQAETVLLNLSRHAGVSGLRGIGKKNNHLLRPLLPFSKKEIEKFVSRNRIPFVSDPTNDDIAIPRNFLRKKILKSWEEFDPHLINAIQQSADHFSEWKDALDHFILNGLIHQVQRTENKFIIPLDLIEKIPVFSRIRLMQFLTSGADVLWAKQEMDRVRIFLEGNQTGKTLQVKNGWILLKDRREIIGVKKINKTETKSLELHLNQLVHYCDHMYKISLTEQISFARNKGNTEYANWSILKHMKIELRLWESGDSFQPLGMTGHQKVSDFLINQKVDRFAKENQTVMTANGQIFWVCSHRISDWVKITGDTTEKVKLNCLSLN